MERLALKVAVHVLLIKENSILLGRRYNAQWQNGKYGLPSGHVEQGEQLVEAIIREAKEETGIAIEPAHIEFVHVMHRNFRYIDFFFTATQWTGQPEIMEADKCDDLQWFPLHDLPENTVPSAAYVIEQYQKGVTFSEFENEG